MAEREAEISVERVDEDLEGLLKGFGVAALAALKLARESFGLDAEASQVGEHPQKRAEAIGGGPVSVQEHQGGVQRGDVAVEHVARHAAAANLGVAAHHFGWIAGDRRQSPRR